MGKEEERGWRISLGQRDGAGLGKRSWSSSTERTWRQRVMMFRGDIAPALGDKL